MTTNRIARLEALPGWTWDVLADRWEEHFAALLRYTEREGHARVPDSHLEDGLKLGRSGHHPAARTAQGPACGDASGAVLMVLPGWAWDMRDVAWDTGFAALKQFQARTGHCRVARGWLEGDYRLGRWVAFSGGWSRPGNCARTAPRNSCPCSIATSRLGCSRCSAGERCEKRLGAAAAHLDQSVDARW